jgi:hypothetical protein
MGSPQPGKAEQQAPPDVALGMNASSAPRLRRLAATADGPV